MSYFLGQTDPVPPPVRPLSWPMILGWTAAVGVTLAIFNGTINLRPNRGKRKSRRARRSSRRRPCLHCGEDLNHPSQKPIVHECTRWALGGPVRVRRNTGRRSSRTRPKLSELGVWEAVGAVRAARPREHLSVLPPGIAAKFKRLAPGLYKYGFGKNGEAIVRFKNASLKGAMTSTRIGASKVGEYHWVVDNFDPNFPVVIRGIDAHGRTDFRIEEYAKRFVHAPVAVRRKSTSR